jgi:outer membrane protein OmpA-like peptidoglycan-associated protein
VTATAGDGQVLVSWSAPSNVSNFKSVSYTVAASPGGASCDSTGTLSCLVTGISDSVSYTFMVTASSDDPTSSSITSSASSPVTPTDAPLQNGTTTSELSPGSADVIQSGGSTTKVGVRMSRDSVIATGQGLKVVIAASATTGKGTKATVVLITGGTAWFSGSGFLRGSTVAVYAFSRDTLLGTGVVKSNGKFSATLRLPAGLAIGSHTIQLQGFAQGKRLAVAIGVAVRKQVTQSIGIGNFGVCSPSLTASMKTQLSNLAATIKAQRASSVVITGYTYSTGGCAKTLSHTQAAAAANYLLAGLKHLGYKGAPRMVIRVGRATSQALSRRVTVAVTLG